MKNEKNKKKKSMKKWNIKNKVRKGKIIIVFVYV